MTSCLVTSQMPKDEAHFWKHKANEEEVQGIGPGLWRASPSLQWFPRWPFPLFPCRTQQEGLSPEGSKPGVTASNAHSAR